MTKHVEIEDIDGMRRRAGINDAELWAAIRALRFGDHVRLTFLGSAESHTAETIRVRITRVRGNDFRGKVVDQPASRGLSGLNAGLAVAFTGSHIHSVATMPRRRNEVSRLRKLISRA